LRLNGRSNTSRPKPKYTFSLDTLVAQAEKDDADEIGVAKALSLIEASENARERGRAVAGRDDSANQALLSSVVKGTDNGDDNDVQRVLDAMKRTEAFDQDKTWSFFEDDYDALQDFDSYVDDEYDFPDWALESQGWQKSLLGQ